MPNSQPEPSSNYIPQGYSYIDSFHHHQSPSSSELSYHSVPQHSHQHHPKESESGIIHKEIYRDQYQNIFSHGSIDRNLPSAALKTFPLLHDLSSDNHNVNHKPARVYKGNSMYFFIVNT